MIRHTLPGMPSFRLRAGDLGPRQQSQVSCGGASLTVARMLIDPITASWVTDGSGALPRGVDSTDPLHTHLLRFAAHERAVMRRTNGVAAPGGEWQVPWLTQWGTSPWGARHELEQGAASPGTRYELVVVRQWGSEQLRSLMDTLAGRVTHGRPALLYVGNWLLPRHVTLVTAARQEALEVYEPSGGYVHQVPRAAFADRSFDLGAWNHPWFVVLPAAQVPAPGQVPGARWSAVSVDGAPG